MEMRDTLTFWGFCCRNNAPSEWNISVNKACNCPGDELQVACLGKVKYKNRVEQIASNVRQLAGVRGL